MNLEYRNDQRKYWNFDESSVNSTLIDSTFSSIPAKRFQRSNSKNGHQSFQSPPHTSETRTTRPGSFKSPITQQELFSPQAKPTLPNSPTNAMTDGNNFSIYSPQYIKIPRSPNHQVIEQREVKNQPIMLSETNSHNRVQSGLRNLNEWKPTDFKKLSDLQQKRPVEYGKENVFTNSNQSTNLNNSSNSFFTKNKEASIHTTNATKVRKSSLAEPLADPLQDRMTELEKTNQKMQIEMDILQKQKEELQKQLEGYKKQKELERDNSKHSFVFQQNSGKDKKLSKSNHNRSVGQINKNKSLKETALTYQIEQLKEELCKIKTENGSTQFEQIIAQLQEQNSYYKKELDAINLRCRVLDQQNRSMGERWKDSKKMTGEIRYLKASLVDCEEQVKRLKGQNKKLRAVNFSNGNYFDARGSINGNMKLLSDTDSLNLSMSWMEK